MDGSLIFAFPSTKTALFMDDRDKIDVPSRKKAVFLDGKAQSVA